jgi:hypothetical protein
MGLTKQTLHMKVSHHAALSHLLLLWYNITLGLYKILLLVSLLPSVFRNSEQIYDC